MMQYEFETTHKKDRNKFIGSWTELVTTPIKLAYTPSNLSELLDIGATLENESYTHQEIADWCGKYAIHQRENSQSSTKKNNDYEVACDVDAQWNLFLCNSYSLEELQSLKFAEVRLPIEWFASWKDQLGQPKPDLWETVKTILLKDWDPIGVSDIPEAFDEYDSYVDGICNLIRESADSHKIRQHLSQIKSVSMGLSTPNPQIDEVVGKLVALVDE